VVWAGENGRTTRSSSLQVCAGEKEQHETTSLGGSSSSLQVWEGEMEGMTSLRGSSSSSLPSLRVQTSLSPSRRRSCHEKKVLIINIIDKKTTYL
jgi:hypothetical protein